MPDGSAPDAAAGGGAAAGAPSRALFERLAGYPGAPDRRPAMADLEAFFDTLEAVAPEAMTGLWRGGVFPVGGLYDFLLRPKPVLRWYGKRFRSENRVDALICSLLGIRIRLPLGRARLRRIDYRGTVSTAMIYDRLPIIDHFRRIDDDTVMGLMETRGRRGAAFYLERVPESCT